MKPRRLDAVDVMMSFRAGPECLVAVRRMQRFLELDECARVPVPVDEHLLRADGATVAWPRASHPAVLDACCAVKPGQVIVVAGPVGAELGAAAGAGLGVALRSCRRDALGAARRHRRRVQERPAGRAERRGVF